MALRPPPPWDFEEIHVPRLIKKCFQFDKSYVPLFQVIWRNNSINLLRDKPSNIQENAIKWVGQSLHLSINSMRQINVHQSMSSIFLVSISKTLPTFRDLNHDMNVARQAGLGSYSGFSTYSPQQIHPPKKKEDHILSMN